MARGSWSIDQVKQIAAVGQVQTVCPAGCVYRGIQLHKERGWRREPAPRAVRRWVGGRDVPPVSLSRPLAEGPSDDSVIDIGARCIHVAVAPERDARPVREFQTFTQDLYALADWLEACAVRTIAMESAGVFWIPRFQILEARGLEVCLVNARHVKHVPGVCARCSGIVRA